MCLDLKCFQLFSGRDFIALTIDWVMTKRCSCDWSNSRSPLTMLFNWIVKEVYIRASPVAPKYTCKRVTVVCRQSSTAGAGDPSYIRNKLEPLELVPNQKIQTENSKHHHCERISTSRQNLNSVASATRSMCLPIPVEGTKCPSPDTGSVQM